MLISVCFVQDAERVARLKGRILFSLLLAVAKAGTPWLGVDGYLRCKFLVILSFFYRDDLEAYFFSFALCPFDDLAFEVRVRLDECFKVVVRVDQLVHDELLAAQVSFVEVDSANDGFQRVAENDLLEVCVLFVVLNDVRNANFPREHVKRFTVHKPRTYLGEKTLVLVRKSFKKIVRHSGAEDGIAQVFQAFVGFLKAVSTFLGDGTVNCGKPVKRFAVFALKIKNRFLSPSQLISDIKN